MTRDEYCISVCRGKCCRIAADDVVCQHLKDGACSIYRERFADSAPDSQCVGLYVDRAGELKAFVCNRIMNIIGKGLMDPEVEAGCCYAHPELLEAHV